MLKSCDMDKVQELFNQALNKAANKKEMQRVEAFAMHIEAGNLVSKINDEGFYRIAETDTQVTLLPSAAVKTLFDMRKKLNSAKLMTLSRQGLNTLTGKKNPALIKKLVLKKHFLKGDGWNAVVLPEYGGQVWQINNTKGLAAFPHKPFSERKALSAYMGAWWDAFLPYSTVKNKAQVVNPGPHKLVLKFEVMGKPLITRTYSAEGNNLKIQTVLSNTLPQPVNIRYMGMSTVKIGKQADEKLLVQKNNNWQKLDLFSSHSDFEVLSGEKKPVHRWALQDPDTSFALVNDFTESEKYIKSFSIWKTPEKQTLEIRSDFIVVKAGESFTFVQKLQFVKIN